MSKLDEKIKTLECIVKEVKRIRERTQELIDQKRAIFKDIGIENALKAMAEVIILERILDCIDEAIQEDNEGIEILNLKGGYGCIPGPREIFECLLEAHTSKLPSNSEFLHLFVAGVEYNEIHKEIFNK